RRRDEWPSLDPPRGRANLHQGRDAKRAPAAIDNGIGVGIFERQAAVEPFAKRRFVRKRSVGRHVGPDAVVSGASAPEIGPVSRSKLFHPTMAALERDGGGTLCRRVIDRQPDRLARDGMRLRGGRHRLFMSSWEKGFGSGFALVPPQLCDLPGGAVCGAPPGTAV